MKMKNKHIWVLTLSKPINFAFKPMIFGYNTRREAREHAPNYRKYGFDVVGPIKYIKWGG